MSASPLTKLPEIACTPIGQEVLRGLRSCPKTLSPWLFYDLNGSRLFEAITELPEYYLTRTERNILRRYAAEIVEAAAEGDPLTLFELGAGTATKTGLLLRAAVQMQGPVSYRAIDVSQAALMEAKARLEAEFPAVTVEPMVADYTTDLGQLGLDDATGAAENSGQLNARRLVLYIGSSIGNFSPQEALGLLREVRARLEPEDGLLLGVDMVKDREVLLAAYNDAAQVTAEFNKNVLARINRELDANFDLRVFRHQAVWNERRSRIEMHLHSEMAHLVSIAALELDVRFDRGETIHTENSYKFTCQSASQLLKEAGFEARERWSDPQNWYTVFLAKAC